MVCPLVAVEGIVAVAEPTPPVAEVPYHSKVYPANAVAVKADAVLP